MAPHIYCFVIICCSDMLGNLGQQIQRRWGDKSWVREFLERLINVDEEHLYIVKGLLEQYGKDVWVFHVVLTMVVDDEGSMERAAICEHLQGCCVKVLQDWGRTINELASTAVEMHPGGLVNQTMNMAAVPAAVACMLGRNLAPDKVEGAQLGRFSFFRMGPLGPRGKITATGLKGKEKKNKKK